MCKEQDNPTTKKIKTELKSPIKERFQLILLKQS